jgi:hypothetical protein
VLFLAYVVDLDRLDLSLRFYGHVSLVPKRT